MFSTDVRIVFLPHTNGVILLEPYCGTISPEICIDLDFSMLILMSFLKFLKIRQCYHIKVENTSEERENLIRALSI